MLILLTNSANCLAINKAICCFTDFVTVESLNKSLVSLKTGRPQCATASSG